MRILPTDFLLRGGVHKWRRILSVNASDACNCDKLLILENPRWNPKTNHVCHDSASSRRRYFRVSPVNATTVKGYTGGRSVCQA